MICQVCKKDIEKKVKRRKGIFCSEECFIAANVEKNGNCWIWKRRKDAGGYGEIWDGSRSQRTSRYLYELIFGKIPEGKMILHSCHNPPCVNPTHLRAGTQEENMQDRNKANRTAVGEKNGRSRLREIDLPKIFFLRKQGYTQKEIGEFFTISQAAVSYILSGKNWKYLNKRNDDGVQREHSAAQ